MPDPDKEREVAERIENPDPPGGAAERPARGRGRPRKRRPDPDGNGDANGSGLTAEEQAALEAQDAPALVDDTEIDEIKAQMSASDKLLAPIEDYRALSGVLGRPIIWLVKSAVDPYKCKLVVERRAPAFYKSQRVKLGVLRSYCCTWPFSLDGVKARLEAEMGGEEYVFIVKHDDRPLRSMEVYIDEPPKFDPELTIGDRDINGSEPLDELEKERIREERMTKLLQTKRARIRAAKDVKEEEAGAAEPAPEPVEMMPSGRSDEEVSQMLQEQEERLGLKHEVMNVREDSNRRFEALLAELRSLKSNDGGSSSAIIQAMQQSTSSMMEGLKLVVANVADQLKSMQQNSHDQFANVTKLMEMSQSNARLLAEAQINARSRETELLLEAAGAKQEMTMLTADKQMELMKQGMEFAKQLSPPESGGGGDADLGWANKVGNMLTQIIAGKLATGAMAPSLPAAPAASTTPEAMSEAQIDTAAKRIADRAMAHIKAARSGKPVQPARNAAPPPSADRAVFIRNVWSRLNQELDSRPAQSSFTAMVVSGPDDFLSGIGKAEKVTEIISLVAPYVPTDAIGAVGAKMLDPEAQQWVLNQIVQIKAAYANKLAAARPSPAPAPQEAPAAQQEPSAPASPAQPEGEPNA